MPDDISLFKFSAEAKNEFDALMKLCDFRFQRWQDRRKYEWQISLGVWALLAAATLYRVTTIPRPSYPQWLVVVVLSAIFVAHFLWVRANWRRNMKDINHAFYYSDCARELLRRGWPQPRPGQGPDSRWDGLEEKQTTVCYFLGDPVPVAQLLATCILALIAGYLFW